MLPQYQNTKVSCPGKLLVAGEYAVLYGAPAISMAVNRRASCHIQVKDCGDWKFASIPRYWNHGSTISEILSPDYSKSPAEILKWFAQEHSLPQHAILHMDTSGFFSSEKKIGFGSSAAVLVAVYSALAQTVGRPPHLSDMLDLYRSITPYGSGIDVATSYSGGTICFQDGAATEFNWPDEVHFKVFFVGSSQSTQEMVVKFQRWFEDTSVNVRECFLNAAENLGGSQLSAVEFLDSITDLVEQLRAIDQEIGMGIWSEVHESLYRLSQPYPIIYKPSGAGGGDIGIAISLIPEALETFVEKAESINQVQVLDIKQDNFGFKIETST